jgi:hypothetical protein
MLTIGLSTSLTYCTYLIWLSKVCEVLYPCRYHCPWTIMHLLTSMVRNISLTNQCSPREWCMRSWRSCCCPWGWSPLSHILNTSYNTPITVGLYVHMGIIVLGPLHYYIWHTSSSLCLEVVQHKSVKRVQLRVLLWSLGLVTPITHRPCLIQHSNVCEVACPYRYHCHWTIALLRMGINRAISTQKEWCNTRDWIMCSWESCCGLRDSQPLSHIFHASYNTPMPVKQHAHTGIIVLGPLHYYRWA